MTTNESERSAESSSSLSRREMLALSAATAAGGLAGCAGDDDGGDGNGGGNQTTGGGNATGTGTDGGGQGETVLDAPTGSITSEDNMNPFSGEAWNYTMAHFMYDKTMKPFLDGSIDNYVVSNFSIEDETTEIYEFNEGFQWWNGDPVTAEDWIIQMKIANITAGDSANHESIELVDDYTIEATRKEIINPTLREMMVAGQDISSYRGRYNEWLTQLEEASSRQEVTNIREDLTEVEVSYTDIMNDGLGNGPYQITEVQNQKIVYEPFEDHPWAEDVQLDQVAFTYSEQAGRRQKIINDEYDLQTQTLFPSNLRSQAPDYLQNISKYGALWMWTLKTNWANSDALKDAGVRRAMAAALDLNQIKTANSDVGIPIETQTGMDPSFSKNWLGDLHGQLHQYPVAQDYDQADSHLEGTDYSREGGTVVGPDGSPVTLTFIAQTGSPRNVVAKAANAQLQSYGFQTEFQALSRNQFVNTYYDDMGAWDLCVESHYGGSYNHPLAYYNIDHMFGMIVAHPEQSQSQVQTWIDEGTENSPYNGKPLTPTVPSEPGSLDISSGETLNLYQSNVTLNQAQSREETAAMTRQLARFWNAYLPDIDLIQRTNGAWGDTKNFSWPSMDTPSMKAYRGPFYAIKKGQVGYK